MKVVDAVHERMKSSRGMAPLCGRLLVLARLVPLLELVLELVLVRLPSLSPERLVRPLALVCIELDDGPRERWILSFSPNDDTE